MVVSDFKTPQGNVRVILPDDIRPGDVISGTVSVAPEGKTEKDQQRNIEKLNGLAVQFPGLAMTLADLLKENKNNQFSFTVPTRINSTGENTAELELLNNDKNIGVSNIPVTVASLINPASPKPMINLQNPLIEQGEPFAVFRSPNTDLNKYEFRVKDQTGQSQVMKAVCGSPREMIVELPPNVSIGPGSITAGPKDGGMPAESISFTYQKIATEYRIQKANLQKNETTVLYGTIKGIDTKKMHNPTLELNNLTNSTITLQGGNNQVIAINPSQNGEFNFERLITGITPGNFNITATLSANPKDITDPVSQQLRCLQTAGEYNEWIAALKHDLGNFAQSQPNDKPGNANRQNAATISQNLQTCNNNSDLETSKNNSANLLRSLVTDPKEMEGWDCKFVSEAAAMHPLREQLQNKSTRPVDYEMLNEFAENIQRRAEMAGYDKKLGPMIPPILLDAAVSRTYAAGTPENRSLQHELYNAIKKAATALPDEQLPTYNRPDPKKDFTGFLDPSKNTLWAVQEEIPGILAGLGAVKSANGMYSFAGVNILGKPIPCSFKIVPSSLTQINLLFKPFRDILLNGAAAGANEQIDSTKKKKDSIKISERAYLIKQDTDRATGTVYRFYKNAKCERSFSEIDAGMDDCYPIRAYRYIHKPEGMSDYTYKENIMRRMFDGETFDFEDPFAYELSETGQYYKFQYTQEIYRCSKGAESCMEVLIIWSREFIYDDPNCTLLVGQGSNNEMRAFTCK